MITLLKKRKVAISIFVATVLMVALGWGLKNHMSRLQNRMSVSNESGQTVRIVAITVGGETSRFEDISDGASVSAPFSIRSDDHFVVRGRLADGTEIRAETGYVTNGMYGERVSFQISGDGSVRLTQEREDLY